MFQKLTLALITLTLTMPSHNALAHGGRLNSEGCHNETKTRTYHCHRSKTKSNLQNSSSRYDRDNWSFYSGTSPLSSSTFGWYTGTDGSATDVDHVVALKDAYSSGGSAWSRAEKAKFANDPLNHVTALPYVNRVLKNAYTPSVFIDRLHRSDFTFAYGQCQAYVDRYVQVKIQYGLSFQNNNIKAARRSCR
jgi:hypothetical protein